MIDLLPEYLANEVSSDCRLLVEAWFAKDPAFVAISQKFATRPSAGPAVETVALFRIRRLLRTRNTWLGFAIAYSLAPFSFWFDSQGLRWWMPRDSPLPAAVFAVCGIGCWVAWAIYHRRSAGSGL